MELQQERLRLAEIQAASRPNATRVQIARNNIERYETLLSELRSGLTDTQTGGASLARIQSELVVAQADLETRQMMLSQALQAQESARVEANRQTALPLHGGVSGAARPCRLPARLREHAACVPGVLRGGFT